MKKNKRKKVKHDTDSLEGAMFFYQQSEQEKKEKTEEIIRYLSQF